MLRMCVGAAGTYGRCKREGERHHCFASSSSRLAIPRTQFCFVIEADLLKGKPLNKKPDPIGVSRSGGRRASAADVNCRIHEMVSLTLPICVECEVGLKVGRRTSCRGVRANRQGVVVARCIPGFRSAGCTLAIRK